MLDGWRIKLRKIVFIGTLQEIMEHLDNPHYLLLHKKKRGVLKQINYYPIPQIIGKKKENADFFHKQWMKKLGKSELIFTRTIEGRKILMKARMTAMSSAFIKRSERINVWH